MAIIKIEIPDGDTCHGCKFKKYHSYEYAYQEYDDYYTCEIFECRLNGKTKCYACKTIAKMDGDGNG